MAVVPVSKLLEYITSEYGIEKEQIQKNGIDLRVDKIYKLLSFGSLLKNEVKLPTYEEIKPEYVDGKYLYFLDEGTYILEFLEVIEIPKDCIGICFPRSSILRMGCDIRTALWDSGYKGKSRVLFIAYNKVTIEKWSRVAQIIFIRNEESVKEGYSGQYQYEGLTNSL